MKPEIINQVGPFSLVEDRGRWKVLGPHGYLDWLQNANSFDAMRAMIAAYEAWWRNLHDQRVYYIGSNLENGTPVKIGISFAPRERLRSVQTGHHARLKLLAVDYGGAKYEAELHRLFAKNRLNGEWFAMTPALRNRIEAVAGTLDARLREVLELARKSEWDDVIVESLV